MKEQDSPINGQELVFQNKKWRQHSHSPSYSKEESLKDGGDQWNREVPWNIS
jgi:hypothetical protein